MKKILLLLAAALAAVPCLAQGIAFEGISFAEGLEKARKENKAVFIDCYTEWCGPCKMLSERVFTQAEVGDFFNARFVNLKIDMEKGEGVELARHFEVKAYPTMLILDGDGKVQHKVVGYTEGPALIEQGRMALDPVNSLAALQAAYDAGDRDPAKVSGYIVALLKSGGKEKAVEIADEFFASLTPEQKAGPSLWPIYSNPAVSRWGSPWFGFLVANKPVFEKAAGREAVDKVIYDATTDMFTDALFFPREGVGLDLLPEIAEQIRAIDFAGRDKVVAEAEFTVALTQQNAPRTIGLFKKYGKEFSNKGIMNLVPLMVQNGQSDAEKFPATAALIKLINEMMETENAEK